jgi:hypothetical protein
MSKKKLLFLLTLLTFINIVDFVGGMDVQSVRNLPELRFHIELRKIHIIDALRDRHVDDFLSKTLANIDNEPLQREAIEEFFLHFLSVKKSSEEDRPYCFVNEDGEFVEIAESQAAMICLAYFLCSSQAKSGISKDGKKISVITYRGNIISIIDKYGRIGDLERYLESYIKDEVSELMLYFVMQDELLCL